MTEYDSLEAALEHWFTKSFSELDSVIKRRVIYDYTLVPWDDLSPEQRRSLAKQIDYQRNPATKHHQEYWFNFYANMEDIRKKVQNWQLISTPTATDLKLKEESIKELQEELDHMERLEKLLMQRHFPSYEQPENEADVHELTNNGVFLSLPKAIEVLSLRFDTTPEELAAWVFLGPLKGGIRAFIEGYRSKELKRFYYEPEMDNDYVAHLHSCWFIEQELNNFNPGERFITGHALLTLWQIELGNKTRAYIQTKIANGELTDLHPVKGATIESNTNYNDFPKLETGLFSLNEIMAIQDEDRLFPTVQIDSIKENPPERKLRLETWFREDCEINGKRGALTRTAEKEGISHQTLSSILNREK